ncbi:MAG: PilN domain-containing protein [Deltaproteobacteria bacterium]|nr:PilN domain-containing protein [Deltaproteobacteria bacterium]
MIKINLLAEKKQAKGRAKKTPSRVSGGAPGGSRNAIFISLIVVGFVAAGGWWYMLNGEESELRVSIAEEDGRLAELVEVERQKEEFEQQHELFLMKIKLIGELKGRQEIPVRILDQVSKNLPEFLWLDSMSANMNEISISGKATTFNAVATFEKNLSQSEYFDKVSLGRTFEAPEGVSFSLSCEFAGAAAPDPSADEQQG